MTENPPLKDMFNRDTVSVLGSALASVDPAFDEDKFLDGVFGPGWEELALKARVRRITLVLDELLSGKYQDRLAVLGSALPTLEGLSFEKMVFPDFVEVYGQENWQASMDALEHFTQHVSGEFAIRPFIDRFQERTLERMLVWADHPHPGVRRLASEGCRPRLPWGMRLKDLVDDPSPILPILEKLKDDPREEIRRSVANNLNDISKDHPDLVVELLKGWQDPDNPERGRLIKHALRTLLKAGHPGALVLLGFSPDPEILVKNLQLEPGEITLGDEVTFSFEIISTGKQEQRLMIDYLVHFMKASGAQAPKVFKLSQRTLAPNERIIITRRHGIKPISTRKYYPGKHSFQPQINGREYSTVDLILHIP